MNGETPSGILTENLLREKLLKQGIFTRLGDHYIVASPFHNISDWAYRSDNKVTSYSDITFFSVVDLRYIL